MAASTSFGSYGGANDEDAAGRNRAESATVGCPDCHPHGPETHTADQEEEP